VSPPAAPPEGGRVDKAAGFLALGLSGIAAYAYLVVAGRALGAAGFASIGVAWAIVFLATAAFATPLEVGVSRTVADERGRGVAVGPILRAGFAIAAMAAFLAVGLAAVGGRWLDGAVFGGEPWIGLACAVAFAGLATGSVAKGACAGSGRLAGWGGYLLVDGGSRLVLGIVAAFVAPTPQAFALALAAGPWIGLLAPAAPVRRLWSPSPGTRLRVDVARLSRVIAPLVLAATASAILMYVGALLLAYLVRGPDARVGAYVAALALARLPLFVFSPLVAIAVPRMAYALARGRVADARRTAGLFVGLAAAGGFVIVGLAAATGVGSLEWLFGAGFVLTERSLLAIAVAAASWLFATACTSVAIAADRGRLAAVAWGVGLGVAAVLAVVAGPDPYARTDAAVLGGSMAAAAAGAIAAVVAMRASAAHVKASPPAD
jgi:O-antigen/teichoic acid export membrane protein